MTHNAEPTNESDPHGENRMRLSKAIAHGVSEVIHDEKRGVQNTDFVLILVDHTRKCSSMVGDLEPARLIEVLKYQVEIIERAMADGRFELDLEYADVPTVQ